MWLHTAAQSTSRVMPDHSAPIEKLKSDYQRLLKEKTTAETRLSDAETRLDELKQKAREEFETDDIDQLKALLEKLENENTQQLAAYEKLLTDIQSDLDRVESELEPAADDESA